MDAEVAKTLGELERKLEELERTLGSIGREEHSYSAVPAPAGTPAAGLGAAIEPAEPEPPRAASRIVDETIESARPPWPGAPSPLPRAPLPLAGADAPAPRGAPQAPAQPPAAVQPPSAAELLRFRDRLEQAAR